MKAKTGQNNKNATNIIYMTKRTEAMMKQRSNHEPSFKLVIDY